ncbi:hypothetical protein FHR92_004802 [Fontibacillus solani]|uniref:ABC-2 type transporter transmembrane domain-containing protein n=1 Tax=Fontibacillus solani TaxID=1572857 RepID=A0A7W3SY05_9BACL|nr:ABC transporter permease [Fontibacillus solani]MBA9088306.1 hypothetical protein [Fontibacillus solani]
MRIWYAVWGMYKRNLKLISRQRQLVIAPIVLPVILMFLTAVIMGAGGDQWPVGLVNESKDSSVQTLISSIENSHSNITPYYNVVETELEKAREKVRDGRLQLLIRIPEDYAETKEVIIETFNINSDMMKNVRLRLEHSLLDELNSDKELLFVPKLNTEKAEDVWRVSYIAGSSVLLSLFMGAAITAANLFAFENENRTRKEIFLTPLPLWIAGFGNILAALTIALICSLPSVLLATLAFRMQIFPLQLLKVYLMMIPVMIACACIGMLVAYWLKQYRVLQPVIIVTSIATFFGAGGFIGVGVLPHSSQVFAKYWIISRVFDWFNPVLHNFAAGFTLAQITNTLIVSIFFLLTVPFMYNAAEKNKMSNGQ